MKTMLPLPALEIGSARFGNSLPIALIAGPCQLESREHALFMAAALAQRVSGEQVEVEDVD